MRSSKYVVYITCRSFTTFQLQISNLKLVLKKTNNDFFKVRTINPNKLSIIICIFQSNILNFSTDFSILYITCLSDKRGYVEAYLFKCAGNFIWTV